MDGGISVLPAAGFTDFSIVGRILDLVVDFKDDPLRAVLAVLRFVFSADAGEGVQDACDGVARGGAVALKVRELLGCLVAGAAIGPAGRAPVAVRVRRQVQAEEGGVQLAAQEEAALLVPAERRTVPAAVAGEVTKILSRVKEFEHPRHHECEIGFGIGGGWEHRGLLHREIRQAGSADLLTRDEIEDERVEGAQQNGCQSGGGAGKHEQKFVPDRCQRDDVCDRRPLLHAPSDVAPAHQPARTRLIRTVFGEVRRFCPGG